MTETTSTVDPVATPDLVAGTAFSLGAMSEGHIIALAAATVAGSTDPVDQALGQALGRGYPQLSVPEVDRADVDPATSSRRYSLTMVRDYTMGDGEAKDYVVMRGDLQAILSKVRVRYEKGSLIKRNAGISIRRGWRPLAVATAAVDADGKVGPFTVQGFVSIRPGASHDDSEILSGGPAIWARVNVWSPSLRVQHWSNVALVFILSCTGFFIMDPFFGPTYYDGIQTGFLMGWVRFIHFTAAFIWLVVGLTRIWSAFTSSDRYLRWSSMWPLKKKKDLVNMGRTLAHYVFIRTDSPVYLGHNPFQQLTYTLVYVLCGVQMVVGFMLFGLYHTANPFWAFLSTPTQWFGVPTIRLIHTCVMFLLWAFVICHVYLVFRADSVERHGGLSAMINGGVWVQRGTKPEDAPVIE